MSCGIYKITNLINNKCYIGQSINIEDRWKKHKYAKDNFAIHLAIQKYGVDNFQFEIIEEVPKDKLDEREQYWIEYYDSMNKGYNMIPGGSNGAGFAKGLKVEQYTPDGRYICSYDSASQASMATNIQHTDICKCCRGEAASAGGFQWKYTSSDKVITPITLRNGNRNRPVIQYSLDGQVIKEYDSLAEASQQTGITKSIICNVCNGKGHTAGGYRWSYKDNPLVIEKKHQQPQLKKKVQQFDKQMNLIAEYNSLTEASQQTGINCGNIGTVCTGKRKTAGGYIWKYV